MQERLEEAVRRVLPALGLLPRTFELPRGFAERAERRGRPSCLALNGLARQLVFVGRAEGADPRELATLGLAQLGEPARAACASLVVAWIDAGTARAAAFTVTADAAAGPLLATSWTPPEAWPNPTVTGSDPTEPALRAALSRVEL